MGIAFLGLIFHAVQSNAATESIKTSAEPQKKLGSHVGLGDPFPGLIGLNIGYNLNKDIRLTAGYAEVEVTTSITAER